MQVNKISNINFGRAFTSDERKKADEVRKKAMELLGTDKVIVIIPESALPSDKDKNIGIGQLNSKYNEKFYDFLKTYTGANSVKVLPHGEYSYSKRKFYCNYKGSGLTHGSHSINLDNLLERGYKISDTTLNGVYKAAKNNHEHPNISNFENVVGENSNHTKALLEAYSSLKNIKNESAKFAQYKAENKERVERRALFECLQKEYGTHDYNKWANEIDKNLFNQDVVSDEIRAKRIEEIKSKNSELFDFVFFKQYLAEENLKNGRDILHKKGMTLTGDCLIGYSADEVWAYPHAFEKAYICSKDWGIVALNYSDAAKEGSESNKVLKLKVEQYAKFYDNIRFDVGWAYINPILYPKSEEDAKTLNEKYVFDHKVDGYRVKEPLNDSVLEVIENKVKEIKGSEFKKENLLYEVEAGINDFSTFDWNGGKIIEPLKGRTIVQSTAYMNTDYATIGMLEDKFKVSRDNYVIMAGNHDNLNLASMSKCDDKLGIVHGDIRDVVEKQYAPLARDLKLEESKLKQSPKGFVKAKFAYNFLGKNIKMFFMDVFGRNEQFDAQNKNNTSNYRCRISSNYEAEYHQAIQNKSGLNIMDALAKAMKAKGLDKTNKNVYKDLVKYSNILYKKGAVTEADANQKIKNNKNILLFSGLFVLSCILCAFVKSKILENKNEKQGT